MLKEQNKIIRKKEIKYCKKEKYSSEEYKAIEVKLFNVRYIVKLFNVRYVRYIVCKII